MTTTPAIGRTLNPSEVARRSFLNHEPRPLFLCEWPRVVFIHYEVEPAVLQPLVPFALELFERKGIVSLAAFTMRRFRPARGGRPGEWLFSPAATNSFFNVRAYVRHRGESGVYFMAQWLSHPFCLLGRLPLLRLPWHLGRMRYDHRHETRRVTGCVEGQNGVSLTYTTTVPLQAGFAPAKSGSLAEFAMERYTAFALRGGKEVLFRVWHEPWPQCAADAEVEDHGLLARTGGWFDEAHLAGANYTTGCREVWMGRVRALDSA